MNSLQAARALEIIESQTDVISGFWSLKKQNVAWKYGDLNHSSEYLTTLSGNGIVRGNSSRE